MKNGNGVFRIAVGSGAAGFGMVFAYFLLDVLRNDPGAMVRLAENSPGLILGGIGLVLANGWVGQVVRGQKETAVAMTMSSVALTGLSASVDKIVSKDTERERELDLTLGLLTRNSQQLVSDMNDVKKRLPK